MKEITYHIASNRPLTGNVWEIRLQGDTSSVTAPGQFINLKLPELFLRRPLSVCDWDETGLTILYKIVGKGTAALSRYTAGEAIDALSGLGNGFSITGCASRTLLIGGGVGIPPLYGLAKRLLAAGKTPVAVLGFNTERDIFYIDKFHALGMETIVATVDGSYGAKGFVTDVLPADGGSFCACGPLSMLKAVCQALTIPGQVSMEERMGCGFGACMGCSHKTVSGYKRLCKEGPVLDKEEILW